MQSPTLYHFDINGTIIGTDSTNVGETIEDAALESLARSITFLLNGQIAEPHHETYYEHVKKYDKDGYKQRVKTLLGAHSHLKPMYDELCMALKKGLFESFLHFVEQRIVDQPNQAIIFRTFGYDGNHVLSLLKAHPKFTHLKTIVWKSNILDSDELLSTLNDGKTQIILFQDDYKKWNDANREPAFGKILEGIEGWNQYGFDDNPCMTSRGFPDSIKIFKINTFEAATKRDYFVNLCQ